MHNIPRLFRFIIIITCINLVVLLALRLGFYEYFNSPTDPVPHAALAEALYLGLKFDLRLSLILILPLFLLGGIRTLSPFEHNATRRFWLFIQGTLFGVVLLFYFVNFAYFSYLHKPLDASIIRFLQNFFISMEMVWESYPIVWLVLLLLSLVAAYIYILNKIILYYSDALVPMHSRKRKLLLGTVATFLVIFGLYGKISYYPLRWSDAFFSTHSFVSNVAMNPVLYFLNTLKNKDVNYDVEKVKKYYPEVADYLGVKNPDINTLNFTRDITPEKRFKRPPNIVMVIMESFSANKMGAFGNPMGATPSLDYLAKNGIFFDHYYSPSTGTARSVWTAVTSIPDVEKNKTSTRNPLIVNQRTLIDSFKDYDKLYFIGGSASWGNIRGLLSANIPGLHIYEEGQYTLPRMDVWGLSDIDLFEEANKVLKTQDKPFFAIVQTSGNHRPYNIPENNRGFVYKELSQQNLKDYAFQSNKEYNSFRFLDYSVGYFIKQAKKEKYFDNTIFVFFGDHGIYCKGKHMKAADKLFHTNALHVPLVFYAPNLLKPKRYSFAAAEMDVLPTLTSLAGIPYKNSSLGSDLLDPNIDKNRYIYAMEHVEPLIISLVSKNLMFEDNILHTQPSLHDLNSDTPREDISKEKPDEAAKLKHLTHGLFETIKYMRYHNQSH